jgi:hypothetical protein
VALVGQALAARGWKLYGWKDDHSDSMTDYFDPVSWVGVAEHASGAVACVDVSGFDVRTYSDGQEKIRHLPGESCPRCQGGREDPELPAWGTEAQRERGDISPIPYFGVAPSAGEYPRELHGRRRCTQCGGRGHMLKAEEYTEPWPTFQANPKGASWHVERGGRIIARGTGVYSIREANGHMEPYQSRQAAKLERLVDRIEHAVRGREIADRGDAAGQVAGNGITLRPSSTGRAGYVEVHFQAKPPEEVRAELKSAGFRWARLSRCWYGPQAKLPERYVISLNEAKPIDQGHAPDIDIVAGC